MLFCRDYFCFGVVACFIEICSLVGTVSDSAAILRTCCFGYGLPLAHCVIALCNGLLIHMSALVWADICYLTVCITGCFLGVYLLHIVTQCIYIICYVAVATLATCVGCITLFFTFRCCYYCVILVSECRNYFLCNEYFVTYWTMLTFGKTCLGTGGCYCCINYFGVAGCRNCCALCRITSCTNSVLIAILCTCCFSSDYPFAVVMTERFTFGFTTDLTCLCCCTVCFFPIVSECRVNELFSFNLCTTYGTVHYHIVLTVLGTGGLFWICLNAYRFTCRMSLCGNGFCFCFTAYRTGIGLYALIGTGRIGIDNTFVPAVAKGICFICYVCIITYWTGVGCIACLCTCRLGYCAFIFMAVCFNLVIYIAVATYGTCIGCIAVLCTGGRCYRCLISMTQRRDYLGIRIITRCTRVGH